MFDSDGDSVSAWVGIGFILICAVAGAIIALSLFGPKGTEIAVGGGAIAGGAVGVGLVITLRALIHRAIDGVAHLVTRYPYVTVPLIAIGAGAIWYSFA